MTEIMVKESRKNEEITLIDPRTGLDWSSDLIDNQSDFDWTEDGVLIMSQNDFEWWSNYCSEYEKADYAVYEFLNDCQKGIEMQVKFQNYITGVEFNDIPESMVKFVEENKL